MHELPSPLVHPILRDDLPRYPQTQQLIRVLGGTIPGPTGYASSSVLAPLLYLAVTQQSRTDTLMPRDREPCLASDVNRFGLSPGYYLGRLANSYNALPVYEVIGTALSPVNLPGLTNSQYQQLLTNLSPAEIANLGNLNACQLQYLLGLDIPVVKTLTDSLTSIQIGVLVGELTTTQLTQLTTYLSIIELQELTSNLTAVQIQTLLQGLTVVQISTLLQNLTPAQLLTLVEYDPATITALVSSLSIVNLIVFLNISGPPPAPVLGNQFWFPMLPGVVGQPSSTPSPIVPGYVPIVVDVSTGDLWNYSGSWINPSAGAGGGGMTSFSVDGDTGATQTVGDGQSVTFAGGLGIATVASATRTITTGLDLNNLSSFTFSDIGKMPVAFDRVVNFDDADFAVGSMSATLSVGTLPVKGFIITVGAYIDTVWQQPDSFDLTFTVGYSGDNGFFWQTPSAFVNITGTAAGTSEFTDGGTNGKTPMRVSTTGTVGVNIYMSSSIANLNTFTAGKMTFTFLVAK